MTESEELFSRFCQEAGIPIVRVAEAESRTPDYEIFPSGNRVVVEIKQFDPTHEEAELERRWHAGESVVVDMSPPGRRMRNAIRSGYQQIASLAKGQCPGILVVFNNVAIGDHAAPYAIKTGMFGVEQLVLAVPRDFKRAPYPVDRNFGGNRRVTREHRRALSAVARLCHWEQGLQLQIFHSPFAERSLPVEWLQLSNCFHYRLSEKTTGNFQEWERC